MYEICSMSALIIAATEMEIEPFKKQFPDAACLITGVGAPITIYNLTKTLSEQKYNAVFQIGIAGTYSEDLTLGETVVVDKDCFADLGLSEGQSFHSLFDMGFANSNEFPFYNGWLLNDSLVNFHPLPQIVSAATVNTISDDRSPQSKNKLKEAASIETMEGACLHFVALQQRIPFLQIRGISNLVGVRDKNCWKMKEAITSSNLTLMEVYQYWINNHKA